jgi:hypothetical protein
MADTTIDHGAIQYMVFRILSSNNRLKNKRVYYPLSSTATFYAMALVFTVSYQAEFTELHWTVYCTVPLAHLHGDLVVKGAIASAVRHAPITGVRIARVV